MSTEATPENLVADLRAYASAVNSTGPWQMADTMSAAADRIEELEAIIAEMWEDAASPYVRGLWAGSVHDWDAAALTLADVLARHGYGEVDDEGNPLPLALGGGTDD